MSDVLISRPTRRRPTFHPLPVAGVDRLTDEAVTVTFAVPPELRAVYGFAAGQHLTVRLPGDDGADVRRSYSICSTPAELDAAGVLRIGVKEVPGGAFSTFAVRALRAGDTVEVLPPLGRFGTAFAPDRVRRYAAVVAGSGITPVLSLVATALAVEPHSTFTLVYGNRTARSVMFAEELADLKNRYGPRFELVHVLSREPRDVELFSGRLSGERLRTLLALLVPLTAIDDVWLCGPFDLIMDARDVLEALGVSRDKVHAELFYVDVPPPELVRDDPVVEGATSVVTVVLDGRTTTHAQPRGQTLLDAGQKTRADLPFACKGGVCGTCRAHLSSGQGDMRRNYALQEDEVERGFVLTCQTYPVSDELTVDYDA